MKKFLGKFFGRCKRLPDAALRCAANYLFKSCGKNNIYYPLSSEFSWASIDIGSNVYIGPRAWISSSHGSIVIEDNVMIGPKVSIFGGDHHFYGLSSSERRNMQKHTGEDGQITIKEGAWIGGNVVLLKNVTIGKCAVVAAGCVVTKSVGDFEMHGGVPNKLIKRL